MKTKKGFFESDYGFFTYEFKQINPDTYVGGIPTGFELVIVEKNDTKKFSTSATLYGFDEIGLFESEYKNPIYGFLKLS